MKNVIFPFQLATLIFFWHFSNRIGFNLFDSFNLFLIYLFFVYLEAPEWKWADAYDANSSVKSKRSKSLMPNEWKAPARPIARNRCESESAASLV